MRRTLTPIAAIVLVVAPLAACPGQILDAGEGATGLHSGTLPPTANPNNPNNPPTLPPIDGPLSCEGDPMPGPMPRLARLTHLQYDNAVRDLFPGLTLDPPPSAAFLTDPGFSGFTNNAAALRVADRLGRDYRIAAENIAQLAVTTPAVMSAIVPCTGQDRACAAEFVADFGLRVFRRPLDATETDRYLAVYDAAADLYDDGGSAFDNGIRLMLEGLLQSPNFLYRVELSDGAGGDGTIALGGYEIASRLAFMLWNAIPDDALLNAAATGGLDTLAGIEQQARRMLDDPRANSAIDDFHYQWMHMSKYANLKTDASVWPIHPGLGTSMRREAQAFIRNVPSSP